MREAKEPFRFVAASYLIRICRERAGTLGALAAGLGSCSNASIFHHTFQSLERHHYTSFSNDFAQWVLASCSEPALAERLAAIDVRDCTSISAVREYLTGSVESYIAGHPNSAERRAFEEFYFCESVEYAAQQDIEARTLAELEEGIRKMSGQTLHYHFINSRLRLHLQTNDFSHWMRNNLEMPELAARVDRIDIYMNTLDGLREELVRTIEPWVGQ
jgi:hypothetical protein